MSMNVSLRIPLGECSRDRVSEKAPVSVQVSGSQREIQSVHVAMFSRETRLNRTHQGGDMHTPDSTSTLPFKVMYSWLDLSLLLLDVWFQTVGKLF